MKTFLLYGNLPVGGIAVCFVLGTYALLGLPPSLPLLVLAFCAVFLVYQAERALWPAPEDVFNQPARLAWSTRHRGYVRGAGLLAATGAAGVLPWLRPATLIAGTALALCSLLYMMPVGPRRRRGKSVWWLKPVAISGAWAAGGVLLPVLEAGASFSVGVAALLAYRMLFVLPNALLADWPDRAGDARAGLSTVATRLSEAQLRKTSLVALLLALGGGLLALPSIAAPWLLAIDLFGIGLMLFVVVRPWPRSRWFFGLWLDLIVAWPGVTAGCAAFVGG